MMISTFDIEVKTVDIDHGALEMNLGYIPGIYPEDWSLPRVSIGHAGQYRSQMFSRDCCILQADFQAQSISTVGI